MLKKNSLNIYKYFTGAIFTMNVTTNYKYIYDETISLSNLLLKIIKFPI